MQLSKGPVVPGFSVITPSVGTSSAQTHVTYLERQSGNVFSYNIDAATLTRTSNRTIPGIQSALWNKDGSLAIVRYLSGDTFSTINTYAIRPDGSGGFFLPQNLSDISVSSSSILTLSSGVNGSVGAMVSIDGARTNTVFSTPMSSLRTYPFGAGRFLLVTKPSAKIPGYAFNISASTAAQRLIGPYNGLTALPSPSGAFVLISYTQNNSLKTALFDTKTGDSTELPISTLSDKCVWSPDEKAAYCGVPLSIDAKYLYPDDWYQGAVSFSDRIWKIDVEGRFTKLVLDFNQSVGSNLDAKALATDAQNTALVFMNKKDGSLWSYKI
jgi:hypothetical protein